MTRNHLALLILTFAALAFVPLFVTDSYMRHVFIVAFIYAIVAASWDLSLGLGGLFNFGHLAFFGIGVYSAAILSQTLGLSPWLTILAAGGIASLAAALIALPVARLNGIYVVLITFAFGQLCMQFVLSQSGLTGGAEGMVRLPFLKIGDYSFIRDYKFGYYYVALVILIVSVIFLVMLARSQFGKSLRAQRDNPDYAAARGISVARQRVLVLVASALFTGIAGGFYATYLRVASPEVFGMSMGTLVLSMVLIGGVGTIVGPVLAALVVTFASEFLAGIQGMEEARYIIVALAMILVLRLAPAGVISLDRLFRR